MSDYKKGVNIMKNQVDTARQQQRDVIRALVRKMLHDIAYCHNTTAAMTMQNQLQRLYQQERWLLKDSLSTES